MFQKRKRKNQDEMVMRKMMMTERETCLIVKSHLAEERQMIQTLSKLNPMITREVIKDSVNQQNDEPRSQMNLTRGTLARLPVTNQYSKPDILSGNYLPKNWTEDLLDTE